ncbi:MAG: ABC transporter ATP-binding protein, partial [Alphaproteobacteria bacterium]|nr:ABC transporter ATP-binding protein [Alphaproteobacteria bacterium]
RAGTIITGGVRVRGPGPDRGVVFQDYSLFTWLTALGNVEFGLALRGLGRAERKKAALAELTRVGLADKAHLYPFELSGGMKQRVAIARTLATSPRVLLMDEPFAALDALTRTTLQDELLSIHRATRTTIVFVTHNIAEAITLADRAIVMGQGGAIIEDVEVGRPPRSSPVFGELYERLATALNVRRAE